MTIEPDLEVIAAALKALSTEIDGDRRRTQKALADVWERSWPHDTARIVAAFAATWANVLAGLIRMTDPAPAGGDWQVQHLEDVPPSDDPIADEAHELAFTYLVATLNGDPDGATSALLAADPEVAKRACFHLLHITAATVRTGPEAVRFDLPGGRAKA